MALLTILEYLQQNPEATLKDYNKYIIEIENEKINQEKTREENCEKYYRNLIGKKLLIDHNGSRKIAFILKDYNYKAIDHSARNFETLICYSIQADKKIIVHENESQFINLIWLGNPYDNWYRSERGVKSCRELADEEWERIETASIKTTEIFNEISDIK